MPEYLISWFHSWYADHCPVKLQMGVCSITQLLPFCSGRTGEFASLEIQLPILWTKVFLFRHLFLGYFGSK